MCFHLIEMYESTGHNERIYFEASENQTEQETTLWNYIEGIIEEYYKCQVKYPQFCSFNYPQFVKA